MWEGLGLRLHVEELALKSRRDILVFVLEGQEQKIGTNAGY